MGLDLEVAAAVRALLDLLQSQTVILRVLDIQEAVALEATHNQMRMVMLRAGDLAVRVVLVVFHRQEPIRILLEEVSQVVLEVPHNQIPVHIHRAPDIMRIMQGQHPNPG
jgi:hypothetical protein